MTQRVSELLTRIDKMFESQTRARSIITGEAFTLRSDAIKLFGLVSDEDVETRAKLSNAIRKLNTVVAFD